jgi:hypothetical protein
MERLLMIWRDLVLKIFTRLASIITEGSIGVVSAIPFMSFRGSAVEFHSKSKIESNIVKDLLLEIFDVGFKLIALLSLNQKLLLKVFFLLFKGMALGIDGLHLFFQPICFLHSPIDYHHSLIPLSLLSTNLLLQPLILTRNTVYFNLINLGSFLIGDTSFSKFFILSNHIWINFRYDQLCFFFELALECFDGIFF